MIRLFRTEDCQWQDPWGFRHVAQQIVGMTVVKPTNEQELHDNGYEKRYVTVHVDAQGRKFIQPPAIDYHGGGNWIHVNVPSGSTRRRWVSRLSGRIVGPDGAPIILTQGVPAELPPPDPSNGWVIVQELDSIDYPWRVSHDGQYVDHCMTLKFAQKLPVLLPADGS